MTTVPLLVREQTKTYPFLAEDKRRLQQALLARETLGAGGTVVVAGREYFQGLPTAFGTSLNFRNSKVFDQ